MSTTEDIQKLEDLSQNQNGILYSVSTVFPFHFFPTIITVDKEKIDVVKTIFFGSDHSESMLISDIATVTVDSSIFFAKILIQNKLPMSKPIAVNYLPKETAMKMHNIIEGLMIGVKEQVNTQSISKATLLPRLNNIGKINRPAAY